MAEMKETIVVKKSKADLLQISERMLDLHGPELPVEVEVQKDLATDSWKLYVHFDGVTVLRIGGVSEIRFKGIPDPSSGKSRVVDADGS